MIIEFSHKLLRNFSKFGISTKN